MTSLLKLFFPYILILYYIKQIDSKLPCVCSIIDHRGRQNVVSTSVTLGCASCATFLFLPHFDVIFDLLLNRRTATWNLFVKWIASFTLLVLKKGLTINKLNFALKRAVFCVVGVLWNGGSPCISESDTPVMLPDPLLRLSVISKERKHWPFVVASIDYPSSFLQRVTELHILQIYRSFVPCQNTSLKTLPLLSLLFSCLGFVCFFIFCNELSIT